MNPLAFSHCIIWLLHLEKPYWVIDIYRMLTKK